MPTIVDYSIVLERLTSEGLVCHYYNGGSFGFAAEAGAEIRGWVGSRDETIRKEMLVHVREVKPPVEAILVEWACEAWGRIFPGDIWVMPASHWSFELSHGNQSWLAGLLGEVGIDSGLLIGRTNAAAIAFMPGEDDGFKRLLRGLLKGLTSSDFVLAFPGRCAVCTLHHHKQLWWVSTNRQAVRLLDEIR